MAAAKYRKNRTAGYKNSFVALPVQGESVVGTPLDNGLIKANIMTGVFTEDFYAISADIQPIVTGLTSGQGEPMSWGISHSDYLVAEVTEHLGVTLLGRGSKIEQERLRRLVRNGGQLVHLTAEDELVPLDRSHRIKLRFLVQEGFALEIWLQNRSGATLTTGATFRWHGIIYGKWIT